jgi:hypothetical protein
LFRGDGADEEEAAARAEQEARRKRLQAVAEEMEREKRGVGSTNRVQGRAASRPEKEEEEEDPLDVFMRTQVEAKAKEEKELADKCVWGGGEGSRGRVARARKGTGRQVRTGLIFSPTHNSTHTHTPEPPVPPISDSDPLHPRHGKLSAGTRMFKSLSDVPDEEKKRIFLSSTPNFTPPYPHFLLLSRHLVAWQAQYGHKDVQVSDIPVFDVPDKEKNMNLLYPPPLTPPSLPSPPSAWIGTWWHGKLNTGTRTFKCPTCPTKRKT